MVEALGYARDADGRFRRRAPQRRGRGQARSPLDPARHAVRRAGQDPRQSMSAPEPASEGLRLDRWLWQARFFKTRALAAQLVGKGRVRINQAIVTKAHHRIRPGDVLTFPQGPPSASCAWSTSAAGAARRARRRRCTRRSPREDSRAPVANASRRSFSALETALRAHAAALGFRRPFAEDRAADPHVGGAELHRDLVVGAHAHAELGEAVAPRRCRRAARSAATAPRPRAGSPSARPPAGRARPGTP